MMQIAFLASPPLKNHLQHNLKKPSLDAPSSASMCRVYMYPPRPPNYSLRSPNTTPLAPSTKPGFRNIPQRQKNATIIGAASSVCILVPFADDDFLLLHMCFCYLTIPADASWKLQRGHRKVGKPSNRRTSPRAGKDDCRGTSRYPLRTGGPRKSPRRLDLRAWR